MRRVTTALKRLPGWLQTIIVLLVFEAVARWILAPLLGVISPYALFGAIFLVVAYLLWRMVPTDKQSAIPMLVICSLSASITLIAYGETLDALEDDSSYGWVLAGAACLVAGVTAAWLVMRGDKSKEATPSE
ncbi:MAG TPA: hypothetical protein VFH60_05295 [Chloroflexia bacterium]|nr:hypothetical protein [Chloroflexia bacterium]